MQTFHLSDVKIQVMYVAPGKYDMTIGEKTYSVSGTLTPDESKNILDCRIDGLPYKANVVMNGNSLHVFTQV